MDKHTAIYARISNDQTGREMGVNRQLAACRERAEALGLIVVAEYVDNSVSAYSGVKRPEFDRMLEAAREGTHPVILTWATDRLYRRPLELETVLLPLFDQVPGLQILTVTSGDVDLGTPEGRAMARIVGAMASQESERKAARLTAMARHRATVDKRTPTPRRPLGYLWAEPDPDRPLRPRPGSRAGLVLDPEVAPAVRQAYEDLDNGLSLGATYRRFVATVGADRAPTTAGGLGQTLRAPRYAGLASYRGEITGRASDALPIVPEDMWRRVHAILTDPSRKKGQTSNGREGRTLLGGGLFKCHKCGANMVAGTKRATSGDKGLVPVYTCAKQTHLTRRMARINETVVDAVANLLAAMGEAGMLSVPDEGEPQEVREARQRLVDLDSREAEAAEAYASGALSLSLLTVTSERISADRAEAERIISRSSRRPALDALATLGPGAGDHFRELVTSDPDRAKGILRQVIKGIRTAPDSWSLEVEWLLPGDLPTVLTVPRSK